MLSRWGRLNNGQARNRRKMSPLSFEDKTLPRSRSQVAMRDYHGETNACGDKGPPGGTLGQKWDFISRGQI